MLLLSDKRVREIKFLALAFAAAGIGGIPSDPRFLRDRAETVAQFSVNIWVTLDLIDKLHLVRLEWYSPENSGGI